MDLWNKSFDRDLPQRRRFRRDNPSFSSSLLDAIYRSIDESNGQGENGELVVYRETATRKKQSIATGRIGEDVTVKCRRDFVIEKWMEEKEVGNIRDFTVSSSSSSSSESNGQGKQSITAGRTGEDKTVKFRGDFMIDKWMDEKAIKNIRDFTVSSSTSLESKGQGKDGELILYRGATAGTKQSIPAGRTERDEPVKFRRNFIVEKWMNEKKVKNIIDFSVSSFTSSESTSTTDRRFSSSEESELPSPIKPKIQNPKQKNGLNKAKSKASKMYQDSKKVKQPISPGGRLASFLNSLFNGGSPRTKEKIPNPKYDMSTKSKSQQGSSTCSSASSFSRSCLSKTPSSRGKSVRFYPISVIVDEDCRPCGHKLLQKLEEPMMKKGFKSYGDLKTEHRREEDEDEDEDLMSCSSSDLFELDNLSVIGIERFREELPVYETTNFKTNCAIAEGLVV